jgi:hypothetical protein
LSRDILKSLDLNTELRKDIPLHLHLHEINLEKSFANQKLILKNKLPVFPYFKETLERLGLNLPVDL